ncbi:OLC1v1034629C1 [Oldenlandia corymbosa var. corymbosa]|uniref:Glycosyltransferases n=1 Tax=Oldenlandia corymbosa var. corymbosa TaxID=529605 RepID=A0AAV1CU11_OLDCO|nr:OLC1v1034629C1 [Oldenlandia corymbosa var. corymbosa]
MGTVDRSKKKTQLWKKAAFHFVLCFVMGFLTGFAPTGKASVFSRNRVSVTNITDFSPQPLEVIHLVDGSPAAVPAETLKSDEDGSDSDAGISKEEEEEEEGDLNPRGLIIIVTPTSMKDRLRGVRLRRLANTLRLVAQPLLWVVVEQQSDSDEVSEILRQTGIMYRHLVFKDNFTDFQTEMDHQRNVALNHIEHHRLSGIVHFADLSNVYDLSFFDEIRSIEAFGTWPMAFLSANRKKVNIEGPICEGSDVIGWHLKNINNQTDGVVTRPAIHISSFAFNSSILWDPERWGRTSSAQDTSQDTLKFVKKEVLEEETQLRGIPSEDCSKVLVWNVRLQHKRNTLL